MASSTYAHTARTFSLYFLYVYSFSLIHALLIYVGMESIDLLLQQLVHAFLPSLVVTALLLFTMPYPRILEIVLYIIATVWSLLSVSQALLTKTLLDTPSIYVIMMTNSEEINAFFKFYFSFKFISAVLAILFIPLLILYFVRKNIDFESIQLKKKFLILVSTIAIMFFPVFTWSPQHTITDFSPKFSSIDRNIRSLFFVRYSTFVPKALQLSELVTFDPVGVKSNFEGAQNVVLIVMESSNRNNFSLNGYPRKTNPKLEKLDLVVYEDVISAAAVTIGSLPHMYTFSNLHSRSQEATIYDIFSAAGFETHFFEGSTVTRANDIITHITKRAENVHTQEKYDVELFDKALDLLENGKAEKKFLLFQTMAAHSYFKDRYPEDFQAFSDTPPNLYPNANAQLRNEYDTAILYLDTVIADFINKLDDNSNTIVLVTTDHGEEVGHYYEIDGGRSGSTKVLSCYEIPLFVYSTKGYKESLDNLVFDSKRPYQTDNLIHSMLDIAHIESPLFNPELSLFNKNYKEQVRTIQGSEYYPYKEKVDKEREERIAKAQK